MRTKNEQGLTFCRPEMKGKGLCARTSQKRCQDCGLMMRGKNHKNGIHHKNQSEKVKQCQQ